MNTPIRAESFEQMCMKWVHIITMPGENGIEIWLPISGAHRRIRQFLADTQLQYKLFNGIIPQMVFIDAEEIVSFSYTELEKQLAAQLGIKTNGFSLDTWSTSHTNPLVIFLTGVDSALRNDTYELLKKLTTISETHYQVTLLLFTELDLPEAPIFQQLMPKSSLFQNVWYQPVYSPEDSLQFLRYLEDSWSFTIPLRMKNRLIDYFCGHFLLLKGAARFLRDTPSLSIDEIVQSPTLQRKGTAIMQLLSERDQKTLTRILYTKPTTISEYLLQTKLVKNNRCTIPYFYSIKEHLANTLTPASVKEFNIDLYLTASERDILELLTEARTIVSRETIAKTLWGTQWEERYSDWAIDQLIHKLRKKLKPFTTYTITTKKGEGFLLITSPLG